MKKLPVAVFVAAFLSLLAPFCLAAADDDNAGLSINQIEPALFPPALQMSGVLYGKVRLVLSVDEQGKLADYLIIAYTQQGFAEAAVRAVKKWVYAPARVHGQARPSRADLLFTFEVGAVVSVNNLDEIYANSLLRENYAYRTYLLRELDHIPTPIQVVKPILPGGALSAGQERVVTVDFYIDEEGKVRVPAVDRDVAEDRLAAAAVSAVEQWRFEPPLRKGHPVLVQVQQDFRFVAKP